MIIIMVAVFLLGAGVSYGWLKLRSRADALNLQAVFDCSFEAITTNDSDGIIRQWNPQAEQMFLFTRSEAIGKKIHELIIPPKYRSGFIEATKTFFATGHGPLLNKTIEIEAIRKNGEIFPIKLSVRVIKTGGQFTFISFIDDITLRKNNEQELFRVKSEFIGNMTHEMRTPLNAIVGLTDLLQETGLSENQKKLSQLIFDSGTHLLSVVDSVLDFSKNESGAVKFEQADFTVKTLVEKILANFKLEGEKKNLKITSHVDALIPSVLSGDMNHLGQVLTNLIGNAVKFTQKGSIHLNVQLEEMHAPGVKLRFQIEDTGVGIAEKSIVKLFQPFVQADGSHARRYGGLGLGLSICKQLVQLMDGEMGVTSKESEGSLFWFTVILKTPTQQVQRLEKILGSSGMKKILVAEDNLTNQLLTLAQLRSLGHRADAVASGLEVVEAFKTQEYDLILMDCQMPDMDGFQATKKIRDLERNLTSHIPIIALTSNTNDEIEKKCFAAGMDEYLSKPVKSARLGTLIAKCFEAVLQQKIS